MLHDTAGPGTIFQDACGRSPATERGAVAGSATLPAPRQCWGESAVTPSVTEPSKLLKLTPSFAYIESDLSLVHSDQGV